jgi:aminoglycoside phosphotransferase (APT) family kinase protein
MIGPTMAAADPDFERTLAEDLAWLAAELGSAVVEAAPVSALRGGRRPRSAFRVVLADGRTFKLRRFRSRERAAEVAQLTERLRDLGLPQTVLRRDGVMLVEWITGTPLPESARPEARIEEAAELLARIHATKAFAGRALPFATSTRDELAALEHEITTLLRAGRLDAGAAEVIARIVRERDPGHTACGIAHGDFSAENLLVDRDGRLRVIDNEELALGILALDLARVGSRWPMPAPAWQRFLAVYRAAGGEPAADAELHLWEIRARVRSAWYRVKHGLAGDEAALSGLRSLLGEV